MIMTDIERDAARYRWIKAAPRLRIDRMLDQAMDMYPIETL